MRLGGRFEKQGVLLTGHVPVTVDISIGRARPRVPCRTFTQDSHHALLYWLIVVLSRACDLWSLVAASHGSGIGRGARLARLAGPVRVLHGFVGRVLLAVALGRTAFVPLAA